jgi:hypothetical protein
MGKVKALIEEGERGREREIKGTYVYHNIYIQLLTNFVGQKR